MPQTQNQYLKRQQWAAMVVGALARDTVLPMAFTRFDANGFIGAEDDTVNFKLPGMTTARDYEWRTRNNPIVLDMISRTKVSITLNKHIISAVPVTDEENTLDLVSYANEVLLPQKNAVGEKMEGHLMTALRAAPFAGAAIDAAEADNPFKWALAVKAKLDRNGTPKQGRNLLLGGNAFNWLIESDKLLAYDKAQAQTAFREASFGRLAGFNVLDCTGILDDNEIFAAHPSALITANLAPNVDQGVVWGVRQRHQGFSMRVQRDYDTLFARGRSVVSTFAGFNSVNDEYQRDTQGKVVLADGVANVEDGTPILTGKNARGAKGTFTPTA